MDQNQNRPSRDARARDVEKNDADRPTSSDSDSKDEAAPAEKPGIVQKLKDGWSSLGLDIGTLMIMFK